MARPTNTSGYPEKSIYRTPLTSGGQYEIVSTGATLDVYGKFIGEAGSSFTHAGNMALTGTLTIGTGGVLQDSTNASIKFAGLVHHSSNSTEISNHGVKVIHSTENIRMNLGAPVTGSWVKLLVIPSTKLVVDNCAISIQVTTKAGKGRICCSSGRTITLSTNATGKLGTKSIEFIGTTKLWSKRIWFVSNVFARSSQASQADAVGLFTVSSATG